MNIGTHISNIRPRNRVVLISAASVSAVLIVGECFCRGLACADPSPGPVITITRVTFSANLRSDRFEQPDCDHVQSRREKFLSKITKATNALQQHDIQHTNLGLTCLHKSCESLTGSMSQTV